MWNDTDIPLAYFISFRAHGTWLHGDERGSTSRLNNRYGTPHIPVNAGWWQENRSKLIGDPVKLNAARRRSVEAAIRETCSIRNWTLFGLNIRTNHAHSVVSARGKKGNSLSTPSKRTQPGKCAKTVFGRATEVLGPTKGASAGCGMKLVSRMR
jgi:hypothetical protein